MKTNLAQVALYLQQLSTAYHDSLPHLVAAGVSILLSLLLVWMPYGTGLLVATALIHAYLLPMVAALWTADVLVRWLDTDGNLRPLEEIEAALGIALRTGEEDEEIDTLGGLVFLRAGRVQGPGLTLPVAPGQCPFAARRACRRRRRTDL